MFFKLEAAFWLFFCYSIFEGCNPLPHRGQVFKTLQSDAPEVFLTVSSLAGKDKNGIVYERHLEINWMNLNPSDQTVWVGLFEGNAREEQENFRPLVMVSPIGQKDGTYRTNYSFPYISFDADNLSSTCLGYSVSAYQANLHLASGCIRAQPHWMRENRDQIGQKSLHQLLIPGTHNSGSYLAYDSKKDTVINKYLYCHDEDVFNQLVYGIRYIDLRVSYKTTWGSSETTWVSHGILITDISVRSILQQVRKFMDATQEIVILDLHRFENGYEGRLAERRHKDLIQMIVEELSEHIIPVHLGYDSTLNDLWALNKRLIVGYGSDSHRVESNLLFPAVRHLWGDKDTPESLMEYIMGIACFNRFYPPLWSVMGEMTAKATGLLTDKYGGLRRMAQDVNFNVTEFYKKKPLCGNIVSTDFFLGNDMVNTAIQNNMKR